MTKRLLIAAVLLGSIALPLQAGFSDVARAIDRQDGVKRIWIPFLGVARAVVWVARPFAWAGAEPSAKNAPSTIALTRSPREVAKQSPMRHGV